MKEVVSVSCSSITSIFPTHTKCNVLQGQKYLLVAAGFTEGNPFILFMSNSLFSQVYKNLQKQTKLAIITVLLLNATSQCTSHRFLCSGLLAAAEVEAYTV